MLQSQDTLHAWHEAKQGMKHKNWEGPPGTALDGLAGGTVSFLAALRCVGLPLALPRSKALDDSY